MTTEPLGPALAAELGGEWFSSKAVVVMRGGDHLICRADGSVWLDNDDAPILLGTLSDGAAALARQARRLGVA